MLLAPPQTNWRCPLCGREAVTREARPHTEMHHCPKLGGIWSPLVRDGVKATLVAVERGDYVRDEKGIRYDENGRAVMAVHTIRDDGHDTAVFAAGATGSMREVMDGR